MDSTRRMLLGSGALAGLSLALVRHGQAQTAPAKSAPAGSVASPAVVPSPAEPQGLLSKEIVELWPVGAVPGSQGVTTSRQVLERGSPTAHDRAVTRVSRPMMEVVRPAKPNGAAVILLPGGGYVRLAIDKEGGMGARHFAAKGVTAFILNYRLPGDGWAAAYDAPLQDVQRAVRLVRSQASRWSVDPKRICVMGFSAGGHLAGASLTRFDDAVYAPLDAADQVSARPDVVALCYALMAAGPADAPAGKPLTERVRAGLAPTFIMQAADDHTVPAANSLAMFQALLTAGVPAEMHLYQEGGHGFGFSLAPDRPAAAWPAAFETWARRQGFLKI